MNATTVVDLVGIASTAILAGIAIWESSFRIRNWLDNRVSWRKVELAIDSLLDQVARSEYEPDAIFSMGRGGAVMAGLMSARILDGKTVPIFMVDREMQYAGPARTAVIRNEILEVKDAPRSVLLVAGVNASGGTLAEYRQWLTSKGVQNVRSCVIVESVTAKVRANFYYRRYAMDPKKLKMPWYHEGRKDWDK